MLNLNLKNLIYKTLCRKTQQRQTNESLDSTLKVNSTIPLLKHSDVQKEFTTTTM